MSSTHSFLHSTAEWLRASVCQRQNEPHSTASASAGSTAGEIGQVAASPAFPFDVLSGAVAFSKATVLVIDMDSVVYDCVRVMQWCASMTTNVTVQAQKPDCWSFTATEPATPVRVPTLEQLLCCFFDMLCAISAKQKVQVELVLGNCREALKDLSDIEQGESASDVAAASKSAEHSLRSPRDPEDGADSKASAAANGSNSCSKHASSVALADETVSVIERTAGWLRLYQTIMLYLMGGGRSVSKYLSFHTTTEPGWTGAVARVNHLSSTPQMTNLQAFALLWSTDTRAFFVASNRDAVVSTWLHCCSKELGQLCGRPLPASMLLPIHAPAQEAAPGQAGNGFLAQQQSDVPEVVVIRHAPSMARRLGLRSAAYLPTLYALLYLYDFRRECAAVARDGAGALHSMGRQHTSNGARAASTTARTILTRASELVNHHCGILHSELVREWVVDVDDWEGNGAGGNSERHTESPAPPDLATSLWAAHNAVLKVTARDAMLEGHSWPIWSGEAWVHRGPPPLWCSMRCSPQAFLSTANLQDQGVVDEVTRPSQAQTRTRVVHALLKPLRAAVICVVSNMFAKVSRSRDTHCAEASWGEAVNAVFGRTVHRNCILAEPFSAAADGAHNLSANPLSTFGPAAEEANPSNAAERSTQELPATPPLLSLPGFQTRASLDRVRERVRPAAQLTFVALSLLWCRRLWSEEDCLRFFALFLEYSDTVAREPRRCSSSGSGAPEVPLSRAVASEDGSRAILCGVRTCEVAEWWHALSCVTLLQSLSLSVLQAPPSANTETLCDPESVFTGCLPGASYGIADRAAFAAFLRRRGCLLPCGDADDVCTASLGASLQRTRGTSTAEPSPVLLPVVSPERLTQMRLALRCPPSLYNELVEGQQIWHHLSAALTQQ